jgi:hypothetical protein
MLTVNISNNLNLNKNKTMQYFKRRFKTKRFIVLIALTTGLIVFLSLTSSAQEAKFPIKADSTIVDTVKKECLKPSLFGSGMLVSQHVWRGVLLDSKPNIQPNIGVGIGGFEFGAFGTVSFFNDYSEVDVYASYTYKSFKLMVTDFYIDLGGSSKSQDYFDYSDTAGYHHVMCDLIFIGSEAIPVRVTASTMLHSGWDVDSLNKPKFTTYLEARYLRNDFEFFVGGITGQSDFYLNKNNGFNIINVGAAYNYHLRFNEIEIPLSTQLCVNPQLQKAYLTFLVIF